MKLWLFSDLHLDVNRAYPFSLPDPRPAHDIVVIAGDLCETIAAGVDWIAAEGLNGKPVLYVAGNHEFYGQDRQHALTLGRQAASRRANIHLLDRERIEIGGVSFLGATLWTDYALHGDAPAARGIAERIMSDHRMIRHGTRAFTAADASAEHTASRAWLAAQLALSRPGPVVVVTHHAPSAASISARFKDHPATPAFASHLDDLAVWADVWVHGHTHRAVRHEIGACRVINNPRGYVRHEVTGFEPDLVIEI